MFNIILNPQSGEGKKQKLHRRALERFRQRKQDFRVFETEKAGQATLLANELCREGEGDIVVVGGDGTLHEVLNGFTNFERCALGLIPCGTGNDFAAAAHIPLEPERAVDLLVDTEPVYTEFMQMPSGVRGMNVIGTGIDVEILQRCRASKVLRGKFQYIISLIISLFKFKNYAMKVRLNGKESEYDALIACVGNGYRIGGGIPMCPSAKLGDGLLDFVVVDDVKRTRIPAAFIKLMKGKILEEKFTFSERCEHIEILPATPRTIQVDGELYDGIPFIVDIVKDKLRMYRGDPAERGG